MDPLNRRLALLASVFAFFGVLLGAIALGTNYWTIERTTSPARAAQTFNGTILLPGQTNSTWNVSAEHCKTTETIFFVFV